MTADAKDAAATARRLKPAVTDYDRWNKVKLSDLGWNEEDQLRERITPTMQKVLELDANERTVRQAKETLRRAQDEQRRLGKLTASLTRERQQADRTMNIIGVLLLLLGVLVLFLAHSWVTWKAESPR